MECELAADNVELDVRVPVLVPEPGLGAVGSDELGAEVIAKHRYPRAIDAGGLLRIVRFLAANGASAFVIVRLDNTLVERIIFESRQFPNFINGPFTIAKFGQLSTEIGVFDLDGP